MGLHLEPQGQRGNAQQACRFYTSIPGQFTIWRKYYTTGPEYNIAVTFTNPVIYQSDK
jgi:hypothetical protein